MFEVRHATAEDIPAIVPWTENTFAWGDYVADSLDEWLASPDVELLVVVGPEQVPLGVSLVQMLSAREGWLSAARIRADSRRQGLGSLLNDFSVDWVTGQGGQVARLAVEEANAAARNQVEKLGYHATSTWVFGKSTAGNRVSIDGGDRLGVVGRPDVDPSWMYWSTSEFADAARGLIPSGWRWRKAVVPDIDRAAREGRLLGNAAGWLIVEEIDDQSLDVVWVASSQNDFPRLVSGLRHVMAERELTEVVFRIPETGWSGEALKREGVETSEVVVYAKPI